MAEWTNSRRAGLGVSVSRLLAALGVFTAASVLAGGLSGAVSTATLQVSSTSAKATQVTETIGFTSPGVLSSAGTITLSASTATFPSDGCDYSVYDAVSTRTGTCPSVTVGTGGSTATFRTNVTVAAGDPLVVTVKGVANPSTAGSYSLTVTTSAGGTFTAPYALTGATKVSGLSLSASSTSAGATQVSELLSFTAPNGLTAGMSQLVVAGPAGMVFSDTGCKYTLYDAVSERTQGCLPVAATGNTITLTSELTTARGDAIQLTMADVTNPPSAGSDSISMHTTSDPATATAPLDITPPTAVSKLSLIRSAKGAGTTEVTDTLTFVPSNALTAGTSQITITAPVGSTFPSDGCDYVVFNTATTHSSSCLPVAVSTSGNAVTLTTNTTVASGVTTVVTIYAVANPASKGTGTLTVSTSSDPTPVSVSDDFTAATAVKAFSLSLGAPAISATGVTYTALFQSTSGLTAGRSQVTVTAPPGTVFPAGACGTYVFTDVTTGKTNGCLSVTVSGNAVIITGGVTVSPGNTVEVVMNNVTNGGPKGSHAVRISTTSDTAPVTGKVTLTAHSGVTNFSFASNDASARAQRAVYTLTFTSTSGLNRAFGRINVTVPAGTVLPSGSCGTYVVTDDTTEQSSGCLSATISGNAVSIQAGVTVNPGDQVTVRVAKVNNVTKAGTKSVKMSTSSDSIVKSAPFVVTAETALKDLKLTVSSHAAGAKGVAYKLTFGVAGGITANTSTVTIVPTTGTTTVTLTTPTTPTDGGCRITNGNTTTGTHWACAGGTSSTTTGTGTTTSFTVTPDESASTGNGFFIIINNVTNPTKIGTAVFKVHSSFDPKPVKVKVHITGPTGVKNLIFKASSKSATATEVSYDAAFTAVGGLTTKFSTIALAGPAGSTLPASGCDYVVTDTTDSQSASCVGVKVSAGGTSAVIRAPIGIRPGDAVDLQVNGVANPATAGTDTVSLSTSSDQVTRAVPFTVTGPTSVSGLSLAVTGSSAPYQATLKFKAKNGLTANFSTVVVAAAGAVLPSNGCDYSFTDTTDGLTGTCRAVTLSNGGATATITLPITVRPADGLQVVVDTVTGTKPSKATVSTSSDPVAVTA